MYDIDPPLPLLRLDAPRKGDGGTVFDAPRKATQPTAKTDQQHLANLDQKATGGDTLIFRMDGTILRLRAISKAQGELAKHIAAL